VLTDTFPVAPAAPTCATTDINPTNITLTWTALSGSANMGRDTVTYYALQWNNGGSWVTLNTDVT